MDEHRRRSWHSVSWTLGASSWHTLFRHGANGSCRTSFPSPTSLFFFSHAKAAHLVPCQTLGRCRYKPDEEAVDVERLAARLR